jgi:surface polysaccharide O-acyltransferase-like enzyme
MSRLAGLDVLRVATLFCIVAYHCIEAIGSERLESHMEAVAWLLSALQNEVLIALSAYLLTFRRSSLTATLRRLAEIYLVWTAIYLFENLVLRLNVWVFSDFGLLLVLLLGGAKYNLPFFPALAFCLVATRVGALCHSPRVLGIFAIAAAAARRALEQTLLGSAPADAMHILLLQGLTVLSYVPFAIFGGRLGGEGCSNSSAPLREISGFLAAASVLAATGAIEFPTSLPAATVFFVAARAATIVAILSFALRPPFVLGPKNRSIRSGLAGLACLSPLVFAVHPLVVDILARANRFEPGLLAAGCLLGGVLTLSLAFSWTVQSLRIRWAGPRGQSGGPLANEQCEVGPNFGRPGS